MGVRRINPATSSNCWLQYSCHGLPAFMLFHPDVPQKERTLANRTGRVGLITWRHRGSHIEVLSNRTFLKPNFIPHVGTALMAAYLMFAVKSSPNQPVTVEPFSPVGAHEKLRDWYRRFQFMDISQSDSETKKCLAHRKKTCGLYKEDEAFMILPVKQLHVTPFYIKKHENYYSLWDHRERTKDKNFGKPRQLCRVPARLAKMLLGGSPLEP